MSQYTVIYFTTKFYRYFIQRDANNDHAINVI